MNILGAQVPSLAVAVGSIIGAFLVGLGMGIGSELGKYYVQKYILKRWNFVLKHTKKVVKKIYKR